MKKVIVFDSRFANSIACAAIVKLVDRNVPTIDLAGVVAKKEKDNLAKEVKKCTDVYVMVDDYNPKVSKDCEVHYVKASKGEKEGKRILSVFTTHFPNEKLPLVVYVLGKKNLSEEHKIMRVNVKNSIPVYMADLEGQGLSRWSQVLLGNQDVAFLNQMSANGLIIADYKTKFGTGDPDSADLKDYKALEAKVTASVDQSEDLKDTKAKLAASNKEIKELEAQVDILAEGQKKAIDKESATNESLIKEIDAHNRTKDHLAAAKEEAGSAKAAVSDKERELKIIRDAAEKAGPLLEKEKGNHKKTQAILEGKISDLAASNKSLRESRKDYDASQKTIVKLEKALDKAKK